MTDLTRALRDNRAGFLAELVEKPLLIMVDGNPDGLANVQGGVRPTTPAGDGTVRGLDRVAWAEITDDGDYHTVTIRTNYEAGADREPCYWLPWRQNATVRIKLKPSKKLASDERFNAYQDRNAADVEVTGHAQAQREMLAPLAPARREPRLFFTAMLTGCSVHIEGETNAPNVFHGNASRMGSEPMNTNLATTQSVYLHDRRLTEIDNHLRHTYTAFQTVGAPNVAHLGARGYEYYTWGNPDLARKLNYGAATLGEGYAGAQIRSMKAAVFGMRVGDHWRFYGQRVYFYWLNGGPPTRRLGTLPQQIWPGAGIIAI